MRSIGGAGGSSEQSRDVDLEKDERQKSKHQQPGMRLPAVLVASLLTVFTSSQSTLLVLTERVLPRKEPRTDRIGSGNVVVLPSSITKCKFMNCGTYDHGVSRSNTYCPLVYVLHQLPGYFDNLSQSDGKYEYDYSTVPFLSEIVKLGVSASLLWKEMQKGPPPRITRDWRSICLYPIPSIIYVLHNNIQFATLTYVDTATYQILGNLKIVSTGILFRFFLKKKLSKLQWMAIVLLTVGTTTSQLRGCGQTNCERLLASPIEGYILSILSACLSALAGVYTEFLMKKNDDSLHWQNVQLYAFGVLFNGVKLAWVDFRDKFSNGLWFVRLFYGYNVVTLLVVLNLGCTGLLVSWIMKFADNIVKVYSTSMAMLLTMVISVYVFNLVPTLQLFLGIMICGISLQLYFTPPQQLLDVSIPQK